MHWTHTTKCAIGRRPAAGVCPDGRPNGIPFSGMPQLNEVRGGGPPAPVVSHYITQGFRQRGPLRQI